MALKRLDYIVDVVPGAWAEMEQTRAWKRMAIVRVHLLEYMSAAYALRDTKIFKNACDTFLDHRLGVTRHGSSPRSNRLGFALTVSLSRMDEARDTCALVLSRADLADDEPAAAFCANILAGLIDLDYHRVGLTVSRISPIPKYRRCQESPYRPWTRQMEIGSAERTFGIG